jgi:hypothetical protein
VPRTTLLPFGANFTPVYPPDRATLDHDTPSDDSRTLVPAEANHFVPFHVTPARLVLVPDVSVVHVTASDEDRIVPPSPTAIYFVPELNTSNRSLLVPLVLVVHEEPVSDVAILPPLPTATINPA